MSPPPPHPRTLLRLLGLARPEAVTLLLGTLFLLLGSGMSLLYPQGVRLLIDEALGSRNLAFIDRAALGVALVLAVQSAALGLRHYCFTLASERVVMRLRQHLFSSLMAQEVAFFDERKTGELTSRLASDTTVLQSTVSTNISNAVRSATLALGGLALLLYTSPSLSLFMLAIVPPVTVGTVMYGKRLRLLSKQVQDTLASANAVADESLAGIRTVRTFAAERHEVRRYRDATDQAFGVLRRRSTQTSIYMGIVTFAGYLAAAAVLWYGIRQVMAGTLSVGGLTSFLLYTLLVTTSLGTLTELWADFMRASGSAERIFELLDRVPAIPSTGGQRLPSVLGRVELQAVHFAYPTRPHAPVLQGIDLRLEPGEVVAIVGPSGAGKSTLATLLARLYDPQQGRVLLDGHDLRTLDPEWLRQHIGVVAQEPLLFSSSIADNIRYGRVDATDEEVEAAARAAHAHDFVSRFPDGYHTLVGERGVQLSGGQKQRLAIARAVLKNPRLLILDEATSALDAESEHLVQDALEHLMKGRTTLIIAHRLSTVLGAHRVLVLEGGQVVQSGDHSTLMAQEGLYRRLVQRQFVSV